MRTRSFFDVNTISTMAESTVTLSLLFGNSPSRFHPPAVHISDDLFWPKYELACRDDC